MEELKYLENDKDLLFVALNVLVVACGARGGFLLLRYKLDNFIVKTQELMPRLHGQIASRIFIVPIFSGAESSVLIVPKENLHLAETVSQQHKNGIFRAERNMGVLLGYPCARTLYPISKSTLPNRLYRISYRYNGDTIPGFSYGCHEDLEQPPKHQSRLNRMRRKIENCLPGIDVISLIEDRVRN